MHEMNPDSGTTKATLGGVTLLLLEIVIPVAVANLVEATITGYLPEFTHLAVPLYGWAVAACALWALVVLNCGPFLTPGRGERKRKAVEQWL